MNDSKLQELARAVIETEARAVSALTEQINQPSFLQACQLMLACKGRVVVTGMGKSGHIAGKIAATLASTGTPAFFVHPGEASHGDLGMITTADVVLAISNSGETPEILTILPLIKRLGVPLVVRLREALRNHRILAAREYAFCLLPEQPLRNWCLDLLPPTS